MFLQMMYTHNLSDLWESAVWSKIEETVRLMKGEREGTDDRRSIHGDGVCRVTCI